MKQAYLPTVGKKQATNFEKFKLSQANNKLGKRTLVEYLEQNEKMQKAEFKARVLDKKMFEKS